MTTPEQRALSHLVTQKVNKGETIEKAVMAFYKHVQFADSPEEAKKLLQNEKTEFATLKHKVIEFEVNELTVTVMSYSLISKGYLYVIKTELKNKPMTLRDYYNNQSLSSPQRELREKIAAACGVAEMTVYRWLSGEIVPDKLKREKIAEITGIPVDELFPNLQDGTDKL